MYFKAARITTLALLLSCCCVAQSEQDASVNERILKIRDLGKRDSRAIPALAVYINDPDSGIRLEAVKAIVRIDPSTALIHWFRRRAIKNRKSKSWLRMAW
jgi:hypothetical protein